MQLTNSYLLTDNKALSFSMLENKTYSLLRSSVLNSTKVGVWLSYIWNHLLLNIFNINVTQYLLFVSLANCSVKQEARKTQHQSVMSM